MVMQHTISKLIETKIYNYVSATSKMNSQGDMKVLIKTLRFMCYFSSKLVMK